MLLFNAMTSLCATFIFNFVYYYLSYTGGPSLVDKKGDGSKNTIEKKVHINH